MRSTVERLRSRLEVPALAAALVAPDGRVSFAGAGERAAGTALPVTSETFFAIGSVTKLLTASLALRAVESNLLALSDPVARWLPRFADVPDLTVRMLFDHTSGLRSTTDDPALEAAVAADRAARWTADRTLEHARGAPYFAPGGGWRYSNTNYIVLGEVIERATGLRAGAALRRLLLDPCGIDGLELQDVGPPPGPLAHAHLRGDRGWIDVTGRSGFVPSRADATSAWTAGGAAATLPAVACFVHGLFTGAVLDEALVAQLLAFQQRRTSAGDRLDYGLGAMRLPLGHREAWGHTGGITGSKALALYLPRERRAVALAWNADRQADPLAVARVLTESITVVTVRD